MQVDDIYYTKDKEDEDENEENTTALGQVEEADIDDTLDSSMKSSF